MCGIIGIHSDSMNHTLDVLVQGLSYLEKRGQDGTGAALINSEKGLIDARKYHKSIGSNFIKMLEGSALRVHPSMALGQTRYTTSSHKVTAQENLVNTQPIELPGEDIVRAVSVHNGNLPLSTLDFVKGSIVNKCDMMCTVDSRYLTEYFDQELNKAGDSRKAAEVIMNKVIGAYSFMFSDGKDIYAMRDPWGFRPLCLGTVEGAWGRANVAVSESGFFKEVSAHGFDAEFIRHMMPGEFLNLSGRLDDPQQLVSFGRLWRCFFEPKYFMDRFSIADGTEMGNVEYRFADGYDLCLQYKDVAKTIDRLIPVKNSGLTFAQGFYKCLVQLNPEAEYHDVLEKPKDPDSGKIIRNFIQRDQIRNPRFYIDSHVVKDKNVALVDDSIVRGDSITEIYKTVKDAGAKEVHFFVSCPPIFFSCEYGIDTPDNHELLAHSLLVEGIVDHDDMHLMRYDINKVNEPMTRKVRDKISSKYGDSVNPDDIYVHYQSPDNNLKNLPLPKDQYCLACLNGKKLVV
ncbi:hypothetical protein GF345_03890 [Candidatus Woesearchaeota archaeon]|nr:hypothetical protein [Candidatus Woesearchaeota archaeon]